MATNNTLRYTDQELAVFKEIIDTKLLQAKTQLAQMQSQIVEATQNSSDAHGADWMDDSSMNAELDMLNNMAIRQRKYIKELENASIRIQNKVYGICMISGDLIDKRRLTAVPTTTKSLAAKKAMSALKPQRRAEATTRKKKRNTITKTPSRNLARISKPALPLEEEGGLLFNISPPPPVEELPLDQRPSPEELE